MTTYNSILFTGPNAVTQYTYFNNKEFGKVDATLGELKFDGSYCYYTNFPNIKVSYSYSTPISYVKLSTYAVSYSVVTTEISGLAFSYDYSKLYSVSDRGYVYDITYLADKDNQPLVCEAADHDDKSISDFEAITFDAYTFYIGIENGQKAVKAIDYLQENKILSDFNNLASIEGATDAVGQGIEGLTYITTDNILLAGNQSKPVKVYWYDYDKQEMGDVAELTDVSEIADLNYVRELNEVWVLDSKLGKIARYDYNNKTMTYKSTIYLADINNATINNKANPEGLAVHYPSKMMYVSDENGNKVYVYDLANIL